MGVGKAVSDPARYLFPNQLKADPRFDQGPAGGVDERHCL
jgi:hypothetical protein